MTNTTRLLLVLAAVGTALAPARAQDQPSWASEDVQPQEAPPPPTVGLPPSGAIPPNPYEGVAPESVNPPPRVAQVQRAQKTLVTWPGFQMTGTGSRVFVQTSGPVSYQETSGPNRVVVLMRNCRIHTRNNRNRLVTRHFNTPVERAFLRRHGRDVELVVELRSAAVPRVTEAAGQGGFRFLLLDFPSGSYLPAGAEEDIVPSWQPSPAPPLQEEDDQMPSPILPESGAGPNP